MVKRYELDFDYVPYEDEPVYEMQERKDGDFVKYDDYAALQAENERLKSEAGYTAADVATAAADGFRHGVRSVDMEQFRVAVEFWKRNCEMPHLESDADRLLALIDAHKGE